MNNLVEIMARVEHDRWANWQRHLHSKCERRSDGALIIPAGYVANLERQISTDYYDLSEREKESDRKEALIGLRAIASYLLDWADR